MIKYLFSEQNRIIERKVKQLHLFSDMAFVTLVHILIVFLFPNLTSALFDHFPYFDDTISNFLFIALSNVYWLYTFYLFGHYTNVDRKSGLAIIWPSTLSIFVGAVVLFLFLLKTVPVIVDYIYFSILLKYISLLCTCVISSRILIILLFQRQKQIGNLSYNTLLIGNNKKAVAILKDITGFKYHLGFNIMGYVSPNSNTNPELDSQCKLLGSIEKLEEIIDNYQLDEAIVCLDNKNHKEIYSVITLLKQNGITIRLTPDINSIIEGSVKTNTLETLPFITITPIQMPVWQSVLKRSFDFALAWLGIVICAPLFVILALLIKFDSKGPIFYKQQRLGRNKKPFNIYKFRSMHTNAEEDGPRLATMNDNRITRVGTYLRKWRIDELPQFINVILGDMSFVGPRPERMFFIDKILPIAPHYAHLFTVKPGITSWGMVKFGYAQNVDEMIERLQYDLLYLENQTLLVDFKIILFTLRTISAGEGK